MADTSREDEDGREHMGSLSRQAIAVLEDMRRVNGTQPYIFTGRGGGDARSVRIQSGARSSRWGLPER